MVECAFILFTLLGDSFPHRICDIMELNFQPNQCVYMRSTTEGPWYNVTPEHIYYVTDTCRFFLTPAGHVIEEKKE